MLFEPSKKNIIALINGILILFVFVIALFTENRPLFPISTDSDNIPVSSYMNADNSSASNESLIKDNSFENNICILFNIREKNNTKSEKTDARLIIIGILLSALIIIFSKSEYLVYAKNTCIKCSLYIIMYIHKTDGQKGHLCLSSIE